MRLLTWTLAATVTNAFIATAAPDSTKDDGIPTVRESLVITEGTVWVDCTTERPSVLINGSFPGPLLSFTAGSRIIITVFNKMKNHNFTMHWHGLSMAASPWSDGTQLTQWPIAPGGFFEYEYFLNDENVGTYFAHSHVGLQLSTAFAPLIISPRKKCEQSNTWEDRIMMLSDIWGPTDDVLEQGLLKDPFAWTNNSKALLLNGMSTNNHRSASCAADLPVIEVEYDKEYRLRWIGAGSLMYIAAGIEQHDLTVVEADGTNLKPVKVDHIEIAPGQRYSTILQGRSEEQVKADGKHGRYLINLSSRWRMPRVQQFAILKYVEKGTYQPKPFPKKKYYRSTKDKRNLTESMLAYTLPNETFGWIQTQFEPLVDMPIPVNTKKNVILMDMQQIKFGKGGLRWAIKGQVFEESAGLGGEPYLVSLYKGHLPLPKAQGNNFFDPVSKAFVLEPGQVLDIIFINLGSPTKKTEVHPMHLHSRPFFLLAQGPGTPDPQTLLNTDYKSGYMRDTVAVYPGPGATIGNTTVDIGKGGGWAHIRYVASPADTGAWMAHCHISPHLVMGMATPFIVGPDALPPLIDGYKDTGYFEYGGNANGSDTWVPTRPNYFLGPEVKKLIEQQDLGNSNEQGCSPY